MNSDKSYLWAVLVVSLLFAVFIVGLERGKIIEQQKAIKSGAAEYISNKETGNPEFRYITK